MTLNICWLTSRKEPKLEWFLDSLHRECGGNYADLRIIIVDFWLQMMPDLDWTAYDIHHRNLEITRHNVGRELIVTNPKPTVWQGRHKLTKNNYFAASNARNTGICFAKDGWIAYVDDLSVLMPGWLSAVREAMAGNYVVAGAFRKVNKLVVKDGEMISYEDHPSGHDSRWKAGDATRAVPCPPNWLFGCSFAAPVNALLKVNGLFEDCDSGGAGMEDCSLGMALDATGHKLMYDRRMLTFESEELHHVDKPMLRKDKDRGKVVEVSPGVTHPAEKGHALVKRFTGLKWFPNDFGPFPDLAALRQHVLNGGSFPIVNRPTKDWYDGEDLALM